jgi:hypothetical protein
MKRKQGISPTASLAKKATAFPASNGLIRYLIPNDLVDSYVAKVLEKCRNDIDIQSETMALVIGIWIGSEIVAKNLIFLDQDGTFAQDLCK